MDYLKAIEDPQIHVILDLCRAAQADIRAHKFENPIDHHNAVIVREAMRQLVRDYLSLILPDELKPIAALYCNYNRDSRAELTLSFPTHGDFSWRLDYSGSWRQGGERYAEEVEFDFLYPQMPKYRRKDVEKIISGKPVCK